MSERFLKKPIDIPTRETAAFILSHLSAESEVLEIGCGDGEVADELSSHGHRVTGLDPEHDRVAKAQQRGVRAVVASWPEFDGSPVDAIAFTRSLHHINPLDGAVEKARELIKPTGLLLIEDFAFDETDHATVRWFVEILRSDEGKSQVEPVEGQLVTDLLATQDPMLVWQESHDQDLHSIDAIADAVSKQFIIEETKSVPYLYRYLIPVLPETVNAATFIEQVFRDEAAAGKRKEITLMGRRIVAKPK
jgi:SAM-dependent methyltransferase